MESFPQLTAAASGRANRAFSLTGIGGCICRALPTCSRPPTAEALDDGDLASRAARVSSSPEAQGWGQEVHSIVAEIAQRRLDADTLKKVKILLGGEISLASIASWADDYRAGHEETAGWHFVDIPYDHFNYVPAVDCKADPKRGDCVINAIMRAREALGDCWRTREERLDALKFLVHFVGDVHQPLHAAARTDPHTGTGDQGGNLVEVTFFGQKNNLHWVWDTGLIMHAVYDWGAYVTRLEEGWLRGRDLSSLEDR